MQFVVILQDEYREKQIGSQLRKTVYDLKHKFGKQKVLRAVELKEGESMQDVIDFGSIKDLYDDTTEFLM